VAALHEVWATLDADDDGGVAPAEVSEMIMRMSDDLIDDAALAGWMSDEAGAVAGADGGEGVSFFAFVRVAVKASSLPSLTHGALPAARRESE